MADKSCEVPIQTGWGDLNMMREPSSSVVKENRGYGINYLQLSRRLLQPLRVILSAHCMHRLILLFYACYGTDDVWSVRGVPQSQCLHRKCHWARPQWNVGLAWSWAAWWFSLPPSQAMFAYHGTAISWDVHRSQCMAQQQIHPD